MNIVLLLIPLGIVLVAAAGVALIWAVDSGQYDGNVEENGRIVLESEGSEPPLGTNHDSRPAEEI